MSREDVEKLVARRFADGVCAVCGGGLVPLERPDPLFDAACRVCGWYNLRTRGKGRPRKQGDERTKATMVRMPKWMCDEVASCDANTSRFVRDAVSRRLKEMGKRYK